MNARLTGYRRQSGQSAIVTPRPYAEAGDTDRLVDEAMKATLAAEAREDVTFGEYAPLFGFFRSAVMQEGRLVGLAVELAIRKDPDLTLLPVKPMPIVPAA